MVNVEAVAARAGPRDERPLAALWERAESW
jgi:hypothetical protein